MNAPHVNLAVSTFREGRQGILFAESKRSAEKAAEDTAKALPDILDDLSDKILSALSTPTKQCKRLAYCVRKGVAFHHAGLVSAQRTLIENAFRSGKLRLICATPTLAFGLDLPAFRVIIKSHKRYSGSWGMSYIPVLEYLQMAGRAGRPKYNDTHGEAISVAKTEVESDEIYEKYILGGPEPIYSKLAVEPILRTYVLSLVSARFARSEQQLIDFFSKTFWSHQYADEYKLRAIISKVLGCLLEWNFIEREDFVLAGSDNNLNVTSVGRRVSELYLDPYTANMLIHGINGKSTTTFGLLHLVCSTLEMRPRLSVRSRELEDVNDHLVKNYDNLLLSEPTLYDPSHSDFLSAVKLTMLFESWLDENTEEHILESFSIRPGEFYSKLDTADYVLYALSELAAILQIKLPVPSLRLRLKYGVSEELLPLLRLKNVGRVRARKLYKAGLKTIPDIKHAPVDKLTSLLGLKVGRNVKSQVE